MSPVKCRENLFLFLQLLLIVSAVALIDLVSSPANAAALTGKTYSVSQGLQVDPSLSGSQNQPSGNMGQKAQSAMPTQMATKTEAENNARGDL